MGCKGSEVRVFSPRQNKSLSGIAGRAFEFLGVESLLS
jgi:hypothetical protein